MSGKSMEMRWSKYKHYTSFFTSDLNIEIFQKDTVGNISIKVNNAIYKSI
jgi:hypothetical protein